MGKADKKEFKELQSEWYNKLKDSGFKDIEQEDGNLKIWNSSFFQRRYPPDVFIAKASYYRMAEHFLNAYAFSAPIDKLVWELHSNGISYRGIIREASKKGIKLYKGKVAAIINRLSKEMIENSGSNGS